jgi:LacI family transcriptional regulator
MNETPERRDVPATLSQVAREAGVSTASASRALNGSTRRVREDLRVRVLQAAEKLNYSANGPAQAMARGRTNVLGLLVHDVADPYFSSIAAGVVAAAERHRLIVSIASTQRRPEKELEYVAALRGQRASAIIIAGSRVDDQKLIESLGQELSAFEASGGRVVMFGQQKLPIDTLVIENRKGANSLGTELLALGHRRFAVLAGPRRLLTAQDRLRGFRAALAAGGIAPGDVDVLYGEFTRDGGYQATEQLLARDFRAGCIFAVNDVMAVGAMAALREHGLGVPDPIAVAGFDDIITLRDVAPALTTVHLPLADLGAAAVEMITAQRSQKPRVRRIRAQVVIRDSTPRLAR